MANSSDSSQKLNEEKELSFSISRILQSTCSVKKVEIGYKSEVKCRCTVETESGKSSSVTEIIKINREGTKDPRALYPWQILSKHSSMYFFIELCSLSVFYYISRPQSNSRREAIQFFLEALSTAP